MTITDIKPQVNCATRCSIYLDNTFYCGLELETVLKYRLKIGQDIESDKIDEIQFESELTRAFDKSLTFISATRKTKKQISDHLVKKGYTEKTISAVLEKLDGYGFVCDEEYAKDYAVQNSKNKGKRLIALELSKKGVSQTDVNNALEDIEDEGESAKKIAQKYMRGKEITRENLQKCYRHIISKGFEYDTAKSVIDGLKNYEDDDI